MDIDRRGCEWAWWPVVDAPAGALEVRFDTGTAWLPLERVADRVRVLVAGPDVEGAPPAGAALLVLGHNVASVRVAAAPEILVRQAGTVTVY
ncbi:MAG: hypothetical protein K0S43_1361 [Cellulosimicrobium sp.]|jgi:hypothetical protein|nr:hypothetical protein [Cellulosimicrobium sp.]